MEARRIIGSACRVDMLDGAVPSPVLACRWDQGIARQRRFCSVGLRSIFFSLSQVITARCCRCKNKEALEVGTVPGDPPLSSSLLLLTLVARD